MNLTESKEKREFDISHNVNNLPEGSLVVQSRHPVLNDDKSWSEWLAGYFLAMLFGLAQFIYWFSLLISIAYYIPVCGYYTTRRIVKFATHPSSDAETTNLNITTKSTSSAGETEPVWIAVLWGSLAIYLLYAYLDWGVEESGGHRIERLRHLHIWDYLANHFPSKLILSDELVKYSMGNGRKTDGGNNGGFNGLPTDKTYLVGYHPHGISPIGLFTNFMTEANQFSKVFPKLTPLVAGDSKHFCVPLWRDILLNLGVISVSEKSLMHVLDPHKEENKGNFVIVLVGGVPEMLESHPHHNVLYMRSRYGFFRLALQTGSSLIPCLTYGELSLVDQLPNEPGSATRSIQEYFLKRIGMPLPFPYPFGIGPFPHRVPVYTVVGAPILCERIAHPSREQVSHLKELYLKKLTDLYQRYRDSLDPEAGELIFV
ncbi:unnamed protein product [Calicophoron daubneyi]|uniref:Acyltransferase n=1 Tax=Calicophoron daubneyi TaxID=300641 RepID=A0AAV2SZP5_CALDB